MAQKQANFKEQLAFGVEGEHIIGQLLLNRGVTLLPLYQFDNHDKAPLIHGQNMQRAAPDLTCFKDGRAYFVEVKSKREWERYTGKLETGIDMNAFEAYQAIKKATGLKVFLFFRHIEDPPEGIYYAEVDQYTRYWDGKNKQGKQRHVPTYWYNIEVLSSLH